MDGSDWTPHYIISLSGGIASAASAIIADKLGLRYSMVFADTTIEDADLYRFIYELAEKLNKPLVHLKDGRDPWDVFVDKRYIGNSRTAHCSIVLKTEQVRKWANENTWFASPMILGMYRDEEDRLIRAKKNWAPRPVRSLLIENKVYPDDANKLLAELDIKPPALYDLGFPHNNCGGMCVRAGQGQFATLLERKPDFYAEQEARQEWAMEKIGPTACGFIRATIDGDMSYFTMKQFRQLVQNGKIKPKMYEMGGCGCFVDDV